MNFIVKTDIFHGPIAVLYEMIESRKLSVSEFSLVTITDEFLNFVKSLDEEEKQEIANFISTAAILIFLKSKSLLPADFLEEEDDRSAEALETQLKAYGLIKNTLKDLRDLWGKSQLHIAAATPIKREITFLPDISLNIQNFSEFMLQRLSEIEPEIKDLKEVKVDKKIRIEDALNHVRIIIKKLKNINFSGISHIENIGDERLKEKSKKKVVILFLSLLELVKMGEIHVVQEDNFGDMLIKEINYGNS